MQSSKLLAIIITVLAILWIASGIFTSDSAPAKQATAENSAEQIKQVRVRDLRSESFTRKIFVTGRSQSSRKVMLRAEISGQVSAILKEKGDTVAEGDVIAEIEVRDRGAKFAEAQERVRQREIEYNAAATLETKGFNSKITLAQTKADLEAARAALESAQVDLNNTKITAPFDGVLEQQKIELGDYLDLGDEIITLVDLDPIELVAFISEQDIAAVRLGAITVIRFINGQTVNGAVSFISQTANEETRTFRIEVSVPNETRAIKEGLTAQIQMPVAPKPAHKISPSVLTLRDNGQVGVKVVDKNNEVQFLPVDILSDMNDAMWVDGLPETIRLITVGQDFVIEGQSVDPVPSTGDGLL